MLFDHGPYFVSLIDRVRDINYSTENGSAALRTKLQICKASFVSRLPTETSLATKKTSLLDH